MPRTSSKASKSLPPLPIVAAHIGVTSSGAAPPPPPPASTGNTTPADDTEATTTARTRARATHACIRTTVALLVFGAYLAWTWPWHREHGFEDLPWLLPLLPGASPRGSRISQAAGAQVVGGGTGHGHGHAPELGVPAAIQAKWGQYAPYRARGAYVRPPEGCEVTQVNILQRHGARYPNLKEGEQYAAAVKRLGAAREFKDKRLRFLRHYEYDLGADALTPFGAAQSFEAGQQAFHRYRYLVDDDNMPFLRASGAPRVVDSAGNWSAGFAAASDHRIRPHVDDVLPEDANSTLMQDCPRAPDGSAQMDEWLSVFTPRLVRRLGRAAPGAELDAGAVFGLMAMCPFESVAKAGEGGEKAEGDGEGKGDEEGKGEMEGKGEGKGEGEGKGKGKGKGSPFCALFDEEDFRDFEYHGDVEKYYKDGYGNALGAVQGVGYVNELLARLTGTPVRDRTTHDPTRAFPLGRALYADFTHENLMVPVFAAIGLFNVSRALDPRVRPGYLSDLGVGDGAGAGLEKARHPHWGAPVDMNGDEFEEAEGKKKKQKGKTPRWIASEMVPFSARMVTERLACVRGGDSETEAEAEAAAYVRILVNDAVQPLEFCRGEGGDTEEGMCRLEDFVQSQGYARRSGDGDFERCYN